MPRTPTLALLALAACSLRPYDFGATATDTDAGETSTTAPDPTTGPSPTTDPAASTTSTSSTATTDATGSSSSTTGSPFIQDKDGGFGMKECNQFVQDCPDGQKCMPYSGDGDNSWESLKCVPIVPNPDGLYDPCTVIGSGVSGEDTCDKSLMCWNVDWETGIGICFGMCKGSIEDPTCDDPKAQCAIFTDAILTLCFPTCNPLVQDCPTSPSDLCLPNPGDPNSFECLPDNSGDEGQVFDVCEYLDACDQGLMCSNPALAVECDPNALGCCLPFCDLSAPICPGKDQQCVPWYEKGMAPSGLENVGLCGLPL